MKKELETWKFDFDKKTSNYLFELVAIGRKTATSYLFDGLDISKEIGYSFLQNFDKTKVLKLKTKKVYVTKFCDVTSEHAKKEGEGNLSLKHWRKVHKKIFSKECKTLGKKFSDDIEIVCEEFQVVE